MRPSPYLYNLIQQLMPAAAAPPVKHAPPTRNKLTRIAAFSTSQCFLVWSKLMFDESRCLKMYNSQQINIKRDFNKEWNQASAILGDSSIINLYHMTHKCSATWLTKYSPIMYPIIISRWLNIDASHGRLFGSLRGRVFGSKGNRIFFWNDSIIVHLSYNSFYY